MTILLFLLTAVLVGYVVYTFYSSNAGQASSNLQDTEPAAVEKPAPAKNSEPQEKEMPAVEPVTSEPQSADAEISSPTQYRDPKTGDTAAVPTNYRFAKRWIKEALVTEGLLDRVYKNSELDDNTSDMVKVALDKFKVIKKYHA